MFNAWQKAALGEASGVTGGYIVPPDFYNALLSIAGEESTFRQRAFVQPMASATLQFPYLDITTVQSAGVSPFYGGVQAFWTAEAQTRTETEPQFKMMELKANELSGYSVSSNILFQDAAFGLEKFLMGNTVSLSGGRYLISIYSINPFSFPHFSQAARAFFGVGSFLGKDWCLPGN